MVTSNSVQITVTEVVGQIHGYTVLTMGHIDSGMVRVGDVLQVYRHQTGCTVRVGRLFVDGKDIGEARGDKDIRMMLLGLQETEIHPGDRLVPGQADELRLADRESWEKLSERIQPILNFRQFSGKFFNLTFPAIGLTALFIFGIWFGKAYSIDLKNLFFLFPLVLVLGGLGVITYKNLKGFVQGLNGRNKFLQGQSQTTARIIRRRIIDRNDRDIYLLQLEFTPTMPANPGVLRSEVSISKKLFESLWNNKLVNVTYAVEDPRIFVLEGE